MNDLILFAKAFSEPTRIRILAALRQSELCVCELSDAMEMSQSTLSTHLQVIRQAGLVTTRKDGKWVYYALAPEQAPLINSLFAHHRAAIETDRRLDRDAERLGHRLKIRVDGRCIRGSVVLREMTTLRSNVVG